MRAHLGGNSRAQEFSDILLKIGEGTLPKESSLVDLPVNLCRVVPTLEDLIRLVYGDVSRIPHRENSWVCERAILTPKNDQAAAINNSILSQIGGDEVVYTSINTVVEQDDATNYPVEFLNSLSARQRDTAQGRITAAQYHRGGNSNRLWRWRDSVYTAYTTNSP